MAINFPAVRGQSETWRLLANTQSFMSELNGAEQVAALPGDKWTCTITFSNVTRVNAGLLRGFLAQLRGKYNTAYVTPSDLPNGTLVGTPLVNGAAQTGSSLITDGWGVSQKVLAAGDYFEVNGEFKIVTADVTSNGSGQATISFAPPLRASPADNAAITVTSPKCTMRLIDNAQAEWQFGLNHVYAATLNFIEAIE